MPRLIRLFAGRTFILLVLSCRGSYVLTYINFVHAFSKVQMPVLSLILYHWIHLQDMKNNNFLKMFHQHIFSQKLEKNTQNMSTPRAYLNLGKSLQYLQGLNQYEILPQGNIYSKIKQIRYRKSTRIAAKRIFSLFHLRKFKSLWSEGKGKNVYGNDNYLVTSICLWYMCFTIIVMRIRHNMSHFTRKHVFGDFRPGMTQTSLLSYSD